MQERDRRGEGSGARGMASRDCDRRKLNGGGVGMKEEIETAWTKTKGRKNDGK